MTTVACKIDGVLCEVPRGSVLEAALSQGFYIPHLCYVGTGSGRNASCGLCFVEVSGVDRPVRACELQVEEGMAISLSSPRAKEIARGAFRLMLADHRIDCAHCSKSGPSPCEIREVAKALGVSLKSDLTFAGAGGTDVNELGLEGFFLDGGKCVLCARCVEACEGSGVSLLALFGRGEQSYVGAVDLDGIASRFCPDCLRCVEVCPAGALVRLSR